MQPTEREKEKIQEEYAARRKRQMLAVISAVAAILLLVLIQNRITEMMFTILFIVVALGMAVFSFRNWRCPACEGHLGRGTGRRFCSKCGVQLRS
ncbi:MAG TPA: hypothetical protein VFP10_13745 [Candidatus Eisenbacteria bacterium]|nr:hypothetical protein [Candidatus Eisenbacteria bacterium]